MDQIEKKFILPLGYIDESGNLHREGLIREANALDEIEVANHEKLKFNERYHDILILSRVIKKIGNIDIITSEIIENLFEADFRFLQTLYKELNGHLQNEALSKCPQCGEINKINLSRVYDNIEFYLKKPENHNHA